MLLFKQTQQIKSRITSIDQDDNSADRLNIKMASYQYGDSHYSSSSFYWHWKVKTDLWHVHITYYMYIRESLIFIMETHTRRRPWYWARTSDYNMFLNIFSRFLVVTWYINISMFFMAASLALDIRVTAKPGPLPNHSKVVSSWCWWSGAKSVLGHEQQPCWLIWGLCRQKQVYLRQG